MLDTAKEYLLKILDALEPQLAAGTPIVVLEPSCASVFRDELTNLLPQRSPRPESSATRPSSSASFSSSMRPTTRRRRSTKKIIVHGHCHQHATMGMEDEMEILRATGADVNCSTQAAAAWPGPSASRRTSTKSRRP